MSSENELCAPPRVTLCDVRGVALLAATVARPSDLLGDSARLDAAGVYEALYGADWRAALEADGHTLDYVAREYGVEEREWCRGTNCTPVDLGVLAAQRCLERAGWRASEVDLVVAATCTPSDVSKCFAAQLAAALRCEGAAVDVRGGGAGGLDAWITAALYVAGGARRALVVAAEAISHWLEPETGTSALLYGDGAAAIALERAASSSAGLVCSVQGRFDVAGRPFTISAGTTPTARRLERKHFEAPDADYKAGIATAWREAAAELRSAMGDARVGCFVPYAVSNSQVLAAAAAFGADPGPASEQLRIHGSLGCAGPLALLAERVSVDAELLTRESCTALAVGGGVRFAGLNWSSC